MKVTRTTFVGRGRRCEGGIKGRLGRQQCGKGRRERMGRGRLRGRGELRIAAADDESVGQGPEQQTADGEAAEEGISLKGLGQLVKMGLGTISGDITEINLDDPKRTVVMELEANNFEVRGGPLERGAARAVHFAKCRRWLRS